MHESTLSSPPGANGRSVAWHGRERSQNARLRRVSTGLQCLLLAMTDRELVARIARSAGQKAGYKQLVRELSLGGGRERRLLLEQLARLTARGALAKLDREHWSIPRPLGRDATISPPGGSICIATATALCGPIARQATRGRKISSFLPTRSTAPCRATRCWWKWSRPRPMAAAWAALCGCWSGATPPSSASFITRARTAR